VPGNEVVVRNLDDIAAVTGTGRDPYSYLGITQQLLQDNFGVDKVMGEVLQRARIIFTSQLNWNLLTMALRTLVLSKLRYLFTVGSRAWRKLSMMMHFAQEVDVALRKMMVECKVRYKAAAVSRLYLDRAKGGLGMPSVVAAAQESVVEVCVYALLHPGMEAVRYFHDAIGKSGKRNIFSDCNTVLKEFQMQVEPGDACVIVTNADGSKATYEDYVALTRYLRSKMNEKRNEDNFSAWRQMPLAGKVMQLSGIDLETSFYWLKKGATSPIVVRNIVAAQEYCLLTRACPGSGSLDKICRKCGDGVETVDHILSHCATWLPTLYVERHDKVARCVYFRICEQYGLPIVHYTNQIPACVSNENAEVRWDAIIPTAGRIHHNRPDMVVYDKVKRPCETAASENQQVYDKLRKYA
uniref:Tick transposon n=1 Tax=Syphacia muris TaxID=451379 RepID=A0A0N5ACV0_9BILA